MATVITNLLSAIPFIGGDLVPLSIILPSCFFLFICNFNFKRFISNSLILNHRDSKIKDNNLDYNLLALIVGFIDGNGYLRITSKSKNYIYISLVVNLHEKNKDLLDYFQTVLQIGRVYYITPKKGNKLVRWEINKTEIINKLIPLLENYNIKFLTINRQNQYYLIKYIIDYKLIDYSEIINNKELITNYINSQIIYNNFKNLNYFCYWLVGFTMAEGSFLIKKNSDICFQLTQKYNYNLMNDILKLLDSNKDLYINQDKYIQILLSSKSDIQKVINFFSNYELLGDKKLSYDNWLVNILKSKRYKNLKINKEK